LKKHYKIVNFLLFQMGWTICVIGAAKGLPAVSVASVTVLLLIHLYLINGKLGELKLFANAAAIGFLVDSTNILSGVFYPLGAGSPLIAPLWLIMLWPLFASTLHHSLNWLETRPLLASALGAVGGPLAYYAGSKIGALNFNPDTVHLGLLAIALEWAVVTPVLFWLSKRLHRRRVHVYERAA
jgi:hypothetical protein